MNIQWFPGHMTKALRLMEQSIKLCNGVIYVLDARAPFACINPKLNSLFEGKPIVYVLNKSDLVSPSDIQKISAEFLKAGKLIVSVNGTLKNHVNDIYTKCLIATKEKRERDASKGMKRPIRFMVAGIPNTGKSTIINSFSGSKKATTGDKAGVTKGKQWIKLKEIELLDTPGTMPFSFENQTYAKHLAFIGSINDDILDRETLALELIEDLKLYHPSDFKNKYALTDLDKPPLELYNDICTRRGFLLRGGDFDYERCSKAVIDDFRKGRIGKICLETEEKFNGWNFR